MTYQSIFAKIIIAFFLVSLFSIPTSVEGEVPDHYTYLEPGEYYSYIFNEMVVQPDTDVKIIIGDVRIGSGSKNANNTTDEFSPIDVYIMSEEQLNSYSCDEGAGDFDAAKSKENLTEGELIFTLDYYNPSNESEYYFVIDFCDNGRSTDSIPGNVSWIQVQYGIYDQWDKDGEALIQVGETLLAGVGFLMLCCAGTFLLIIVLLIVLIVKRR
jgi:hypothetical protein